MSDTHSFSGPYELAEHLYKESTTPTMPTHEKARIATFAVRYAVNEWPELKEKYA